MLRISLVLCCIHFCVFTSYLTAAMTPEQKAKIHEHFETIGKLCIKDNAITPEDIKDLRSKKVPSGPNAPCFMACLMRHIGIMDDNGTVQKETALELAKSVFNDGEELKLIEDYLHSCSHVNSEPVNDGTKGCDRAILAYKCMTENAPQFGMDV